MTLSERIGLDLGSLEAGQLGASVAAAAGAGMVRVRFPLGDRPGPDDPYLDAARDTTESLRRAGLRVLAVVDGDLTVAPEGMGTFTERPPEALAKAWSAEISTNARLLAEAIGQQVSAWEILPMPNAGSPPRIAPLRWATLLAEIEAGIRAASPWATVVAGSLLSDEADDGVDYLRQVYREAEASGLWSPSAPPFDTLGLRLNILPDGGPSEEAVAATVTERTRRLWRVAEHFEGTEGAKQRGVFVTGLYWDAESSGEDVQARNVWTALNTLSADPIVRGIIWTGLTDSPEAAGGLYRGESLAEHDRRPSWQAFNDFALYARQISPVPAPEALLEPADETAAAPLVDAGEPAESAPAPVVETGATESHIVAEAEAETEELPLIAPSAADAPPPDGPAETEPEPEPAPVPFEEPDGVADAVADGDGAEADEPTETTTAVPDAPAAAPEGETVTFRIPGAAEVLQAQGIEGDKLARVLAAVESRFGDAQWLPPGEYSIHLRPEAPQESAAATYTNQQVLSALYRAGGGTWVLFERSGLVLSDLAAHRSQPYGGPDLEALGLEAEELAAVRQELESG